MPRSGSCRGKDERHGTAIKSLPNRPRSSGCKPDDSALSSAERQHLCNASFFLSQLSQENRSGRERVSSDQASNNQVRKIQISIQGSTPWSKAYEGDLVPFTAFLNSSTKRWAASASGVGAVFLGGLGLVFKSFDKAEHSKEQSHSGCHIHS